MKKRTLFGIIIVCVIGIFLLFFNKPSIESKAGLLMDVSTGDILFAKNELEELPVASVSKMMSAYVILEAIEDGKIAWDEDVFISEKANTSEQQAVQIAVNVGDFMSVRDLFAALLIPSANNATIALAEHVAGSEEQFTRMMNEKASAIGLSEQTTFVNATGLTIDGNRNTMSAMDVALLARRLITDFPMVLDFTSMPFYDMESSTERIYSTNRLLFSNESLLFDKRVDGLKTGYTSDAGYCFISTAAAGDKRYISIILGAEDEDSRFTETKKLLSYGFQPFYAPWTDRLKLLLQSFIR